MNNRITFIHIPKTGGTTLSTYLDDLFDVAQICPFHDPIALERQAAGLGQYNLFKGHFLLSRLPAVAVGQTKMITFLRHPVQRVLSGFHHWRRDPALYSNFARSPLLHGHNIQTMALSPLGLREYATLRHHLDAAKKALESLFFVGIQEYFDDSCSALFRQLGRANTLFARQRNVGQDRPEVPPQLVSELTQSNWADMELYDYALDLFLRRRQEPAADRETNIDAALPLTSTDTGLRYRMSQPLTGSGWHEREGLDNPDRSCWRWTGPHTESTLYFHLRPQSDYAFSLRVINAVSSDVLESLRVYVNGTPIELRQARKPWYRRHGSASEPGWLYEGRVASKQLTGLDTPNKLSLTVTRTMPRCDADPNSSSDTLCGLAIAEINFEPLLQW